MQNGNALRSSSNDRYAPRPPRVFEEANFEAKLRRERRRSIIPPEPVRVPRELVEAEQTGLFEAAGLTTRQWKVLALHFNGHSFSEIGRALGCSKQAAHAMFRLARRKFEKAYAEYPYHGLAEVYEAEVRRGRIPSQKRTAR